MKLKMYLANICVDQYDIEFIDLETVQQRQQYLEMNAKMLYWKHYKKIEIANVEPIFFVDIMSKMQITDQWYQYIENHSGIKEEVKPWLKNNRDAI
jgi:hypothetical protein